MHSFAHWMINARTLGNKYGDEICQNPPGQEQVVMAINHAAIYGAWEIDYCQHGSGLPNAQNLVYLKPYYQALFQAQLLPCNLQMALSFADVRQTEWPISYKDCTSSPQPYTHYHLANWIRLLNALPESLVMDSFPQTKCLPGRLLLDDCNRYITPELGDKIAGFVNSGGTYLAQTETDRYQERKFLRERFGLSLEPRGEDGSLKFNDVTIPIKGSCFNIMGDELTAILRWEDGKVAVASKKIGSGRVVYCGGPIFNQDGYSEALITLVASLLERAGLERNVGTDVLNVEATLFRLKNGNPAVMLFNKNAGPKEIEVWVAEKYLADRQAAYNWRDESRQDVAHKPGQGCFRVKLPGLDSALVELVGGGQNGPHG